MFRASFNRGRGMTDKFHPHELRVIAERIKLDIDAYCFKHFEEERRTHLGVSVIGDDCVRKTWFGFRWVKLELFSGRMKRLFNRGHLEEIRMVAWLKGVGFTVETIDEETGKQNRVGGYKGHFGGSNDGQGTHVKYVNGIPLIIEYKTHNDKSFTKLVKDGVQKSKPQHYSQMSTYGEKKGYHYGLYMATNKDTDEIHIELLELNWKLSADLEKRAAYVIDAKQFPPRIAEQESYYECKMCVYAGVCHRAEPYEINCRSCHYATAIDGGLWHCDLHGGVIPKDFIPKGCDKHREVGRV